MSDAGAANKFGGVIDMKRRLIGVATAVLGTVLIGGVAVPHAAAVDPVVPTTVVLPVFGVPLTVGITTGPGGALTNVTVNSANASVATKLKPNKVVFETTNPTAGGDPARVVIKSKHGGQSVSARAGTLLQVSGPGSWSGDVFGTAVASSVAFIIGGTDTAPDITGIVPTPGAGITATVGTVEHSTGGDEDESGASARVSVTFSTATQSRSLTIAVKVGTNDDGETSAKVSVSLGRLKGVAVLASAAAGQKTWSGVLCNGSPATITYDVAADGTVSNVKPTPASAAVSTEEGKITVRFSDNEKVRIKVRLDNGMITISVDERINCENAPNPTTNAPTAIPADNSGDNNGDNHDKHHGGGSENNG
jgi:hypothetical protein